MGFNFPASPAVGTLYPASITVGLPQYRWDGEKWKIYAGSTNSAGTFRRFEYLATAGQTTFSGMDINGNVLAYTPNNIELFLNGTLLNVADYTAGNGTSVVLPALAPLDQVTIVAFTYGVITDAVLKAGDTMTGTLNGPAFTASGIVRGAEVDIVRTAAGGANLLLTGDGATTPNKYIRASQGLLEFLNSNYSTVIATLTDAGELNWKGVAWTAFSVGLTFTGGSGVTGTMQGTYRKFGRLLAFTCSAQVNFTTAPSQMQFVLPASSVADGTYVVPAADISSLTPLVAQCNGAGSITMSAPTVSAHFVTVTGLICCTS